MMMKRASATASQLAARSPIRVGTSSRHMALRVIPEVKEEATNNVVQQEQQQQPQQPQILRDPKATQAPGAPDSAAKTEPAFALLNQTNEIINGRACMLGVLAALGVEAFTHHSVFTQVAGKYVNQELVTPSYGASILAFGMIVALVTLGTLAPRLIEDKKPDSEANGIWTPKAERWNGRAAMVGFAALLIVEAVKGSSLL